MGHEWITVTRQRRLQGVSSAFFGGPLVGFGEDLEWNIRVRTTCNEHKVLGT